MTRSISKSLLTVASVVLVISLVWYSYREQEKDVFEWNQNLVLLSHKLQLEQTEENVKVVLAEEWPKELYHSERVSTPTPGWGAQNFILLIDYNDKKIAALAIRTSDSYQRLPIGAPQDRIRPGFTPYWSVQDESTDDI